MDNYILDIKDTDPLRFLLSLGEELSEKLLSHEKVGMHVLSAYKTEKEKNVFVTGYIAALIDYHAATISGRLTEIKSGLDFDGTENIPNRGVGGG